MSLLANPIISWTLAIIVTTVLIAGIMTIVSGAMYGAQTAQNRRAQRLNRETLDSAGESPMVTITWNKPEVSAVENGLCVTGSALIVTSDVDGKEQSRRTVPGVSTEIPLETYDPIDQIELVLHYGVTDSVGLTHSDGSRTVAQMFSN